MNSLLNAAINFLRWDQGSISTRELRKRYLSPALCDEDDSQSQDERVGHRAPYRAGVYAPRRTTVRNAARKHAAPYIRRATPTVDLPPSGPEDVAEKLREAEAKVERLQEVEEKLRQKLRDEKFLLVKEKHEMEAKFAWNTERIVTERVAEVQNAADAWLAKIQEEMDALRMSLRESERSRLSAERRAELHRLKAKEAREELAKAQKRAEQAEHELFAERSARLREEQEKQRRAEEERRRADEEKRRAEEQQKVEAMKFYNLKWDYLKQYPDVTDKHWNIPFEHFPWPVFASSPSAEALTKDAIRAFLFDDLWTKEELRPTANKSGKPMTKKDFVMEEIRRFHPDKNTKVVEELLDEKDREAIKASLHMVTCLLNELKAEL